MLIGNQVDPVVHQTHAGFVLPGNQTVGTFPIDRAFILDLHAIGLKKAVFQMADFYEIDLRKLLDGERKSEKMNEELKETVLKIAEYSNSEKIRITAVLIAYNI